MWSTSQDGRFQPIHPVHNRNKHCSGDATFLLYPTHARLLQDVFTSERLVWYVPMDDSILVSLEGGIPGEIHNEGAHKAGIDVVGSTGQGLGKEDSGSSQYPN